VGSIRKIGVEPITHEPEFVTGYGMGRSLCVIFNARNNDIFSISFRGTYKAVQICAAFNFVKKQGIRGNFSAFPRVRKFAHPFSLF
jgi:hypothetical protein